MLLIQQHLLSIHSVSSIILTQRSCPTIAHKKTCSCEFLGGQLGRITSETISSFSDIGIFSVFGIKTLLNFQLNLLQTFDAKAVVVQVKSTKNLVLYMSVLSKVAGSQELIKKKNVNFLISSDFFPLWSTRKEKKKDQALGGNPGVTPEFSIIKELMKVGEATAF